MGHVQRNMINKMLFLSTFDLFFFLSISAKQKLDEDLEEIANQVNPSKDLEDTTGSEVKSKETNDDDSVRPSEKLMKKMPVVSYLHFILPLIERSVVVH